MLVLSRKLGEEIILQDEKNALEIKLIVTRIVRNYVSLGIEAPANISIVRKELIEKNKQGPLND